MEMPHIKSVAKARCVLASALLFGALAVPSVAFAAEGQSEAADSGQSQHATAKAPIAGEKSETVYINVDADGAVTGIEVETLLTNPNGSEKLSDATSLTIEKVTDDVEFDGSADNMVWHADGSDVHYRAMSDKGAPIALTISYTLDGNPVNAQELLGKSGKVTIRYEFTNLTGSTDKEQVPMIAVAGLMVDADCFKNIEIDHGRVVQDDGRIVIIGYAFPGLDESLGGNVAGFDLPSSFEVSADVEDFELGSTLVMVSGNALDDIDSDTFDTAGLSDTSVELKDAMSKILDASTELEDGLATLADATHQIDQGIKQLSNGIGDLQDAMPSAVEGADALAEGAETLYEGSQAVSEGIAALAQGSAAVAYNIAVIAGQVDGQQGESVPAMASGAHQVADALTTIHDNIALLKQQVAMAADAAETLVAALSSDTVAQAVSALSEAAGELQIDLEAMGNVAASAAQLESDAGQVQQDIDSAIATLDAIDLTKIEDPALVQSIEQAKAELSTAQSDAANLVTDTASVAASAQSLSTDKTAAALAALANLDLAQQLAEAGQLANGLRAIEAAIGTDDDAQTALGGLNEVQKGSEALAAGLDVLTDGLVQLSGAAQQVSNGAAQLADAETGMPTLVDGMEELVSGMDDFKDMMTVLQEGVDALSDGSVQLSEGADALAEGMDSAVEGAGEFKNGLKEFNDKGISEITRVIDEEVVALARSLENLADNGRAYDNYGGKAAGTPSTVRFVFEVSGIQYES